MQVKWRVRKQNRLHFIGQKSPSSQTFSVVSRKSTLTVMSTIPAVLITATGESAPITLEGGRARCIFPRFQFVLILEKARRVFAEFARNRFSKLIHISV